MDLNDRHIMGAAERGMAPPAHGGLERRDLVARAQRDAVADWLQLHPARLARFAPDVLEAMLPLVEGDRTERTHRAQSEAAALWLGVAPQDLAGLSAEGIRALAARMGRDQHLQLQVARLEGELTAARAQVRRLETQMRTDPLTGVGNRRAVEGRLAEEVERARRHGHSVAVLVADIDEFRRLNDRFGHMAGDALLREVAGRLLRAVRRIDVLGRWGEDDFVAVCPQTDAAAAALVAAKLVEAVLSSPVQLPGGPLPVSLSVGYAVAPTPGADAGNLVSAAQEALERARAAGRGTVSD